MINFQSFAVIFKLLIIKSSFRLLLNDCVIGAPPPFNSFCLQNVFKCNNK